MSRARLRSAVAGLAVAVLLSAAAGDAAPVAVDASWSRIQPGGKTKCARGGPYAFWTRVADPKRLVVFFQGGGGCFDETTCAVGSPWFADSVGPEDHPRNDGGIFDLADRRNPFREWSFVVIPSCTGDVHLGDRRVRYGSVTVEQRGWQNARSALSWAFERFDEVDAVFVVGCSAGSVGSVFHLPAVLARWPGARVSQLGDSLAFVFHRPITLEDWGAPQHFPSFFSVGSRRFTMAEYLKALARRYPARVLARFNHAGDDVQEAFYGAVGGKRADFQGRLRATERQLKSLPNYRSYLACGDEHCSVPTPGFYTTRVDGVLLSDWVAKLAAGRDVTCPTCGGRR